MIISTLSAQRQKQQRQLLGSPLTSGGKMSVKKSRPKLWTKPYRPPADKVCRSPSEPKLDMSWQSGRKLELMPVFLLIYQHYYSTVARKNPVGWVTAFFTSFFPWNICQGSVSWDIWELLKDKLCKKFSHNPWKLEKSCFERYQNPSKWSCTWNNRLQIGGPFTSGLSDQKKTLWEGKKGKCFHKMLFPWHQKCLWRGWEVLHSQTTAGTVGKSENSLLWPDMCFISGEGMKAFCDVLWHFCQSSKCTWRSCREHRVCGWGGRVHPLLSVQPPQQSCSSIVSFGGPWWVPAG